MITNAKTLPSSQYNYLSEIATKFFCALFDGNLTEGLIEEYLSKREASVKKMGLEWTKKVIDQSARLFF